jgi:hypothetical protein
MFAYFQVAALAPFARMRALRTSSEARHPGDARPFREKLGRDLGIELK